MPAACNAKRAAILSTLLGVSVLAATRPVRRATRWGSTAEEQAAALPGDSYLEGEPGARTVMTQAISIEGEPGARTVMTRAISIAAPPEVVWPWLAQMGRGAGWYSYDRLDNGARTSARHIVSWIPDPHIGDASALGWLRGLEPGRSMTWWLPGDDAFGTTMRMVVDIRLVPEGRGSRLVIRVSGDATGAIGSLVVRAFEVVDSIMAIRQLKAIRSRAEAFGARTSDPAAPESEQRDQYQLYEAIWRSGERAGSIGREKADLWRRDAQAAGVVSVG